MKQIIFKWFCLFLILILIGFNSCNKNSNEIDAKRLHIDKIEKYILLSDIASDVEFIFLDNTKESFFDFIDNFILWDGNFYFTDFNKKQLFIFSSNGKFINKINKLGKGPSEYAIIHDFTIDVDNKQIVIYDIASSNFLRYTLEGDFIEKIPTDFFGREICGLPDGKILLYSADNYNSYKKKQINPGLILLNSKFEYEKHLLKLDKPANLLIKKSLFGLYKSVLFNPYWSYTTYSVNNNNELIPKWYFDFGDYEMKNINDLKSEKISLHELLNRNKAYSTSTLFSDQKLLLFSEGIGDKHYLVCVDQGSGKIYSGINIVNDILGPQLLIPIGISSEYVYFNCPIYEIGNIKNSEKRYLNMFGSHIPEKYLDMLKKAIELENYDRLQVIIKAKIKNEK